MQTTQAAVKCVRKSGKVTESDKMNLGTQRKLVDSDVKNACFFKSLLLCSCLQVLQAKSRTQDLDNKTSGFTKWIKTQVKLF